MAPQRKKPRLSDSLSDTQAAALPDAPAALPSEVLSPTTAKAPKPDKTPRTIFIRSLPATTTTTSLTTHFSQSYPVKHATAVLDPVTKTCRGYGFVTFADGEDAARAVGEFDGKVFEGRRVRVEIAEARHRGAAGAGAGAGAAAAAEGLDGQEGDVGGADTTVVKPKVQIKPAKKGKPPPDPSKSTKLIVRNLPWSIKTEEDLAALFREFGKVKHATMPEKRPGLLKGFGFVVMRGRANAVRAVEGLNGREVGGRTLAVDWAVEKSVWEKAQGDEEADAGVIEDVDVDDEVGDGAEELDEQVDGEEEGVEPDDEDDFEDMEDEDEEIEDAEGGVKLHLDASSNESTIFIRNLPFTVTDEDLEDHFSQFGPIRYARIVMDRGTDRPRGTGFVCFTKKDTADACLREAPKPRQTDNAALREKKDTTKPVHSILQNEEADPSGRYTIEGRILQLSRAVEKSEADRLTQEGVTRRDRDKRRLYLLNEGTISPESSLYQKLAPSDVKMREASLKQRKTLVQSNPSLNLSLTRLSVRNIPRSITSKDLKALAREAVVGFATDVKEGRRQKLSKEELARGGDEMKEAERLRKLKGKGIVKQATVVYESEKGGKVSEKTGAGRSRGYGFIEYYTHRSALMGLRWLNGHAINYQAKQTGKKMSKEDVEDRKKRLIVEFAIENAQVVHRRNERETKARERPANSGAEKDTRRGHGRDGAKSGSKAALSGKKRKRNTRDDEEDAETGAQRSATANGAEADDKLAKRTNIIARKRMKRRMRTKGGK